MAVRDLASSAAWEAFERRRDGSVKGIQANATSWKLDGECCNSRDTQQHHVCEIYIA